MSHYNTIFKYMPRLLAVLLAAALAFCFAPAAFADETEDETAAEITEDAVAETAAPKVTSGSCGANLSWSFSAGTLTISGSGAMTDFPESTFAPWYSFRREIISVSLPSGITKIGNLAFYQCSALKSVTIPDSVTEIGRYSFDGCSSMTMLNLGSSVRKIGEAAFRECYALKAVRFPSSLNTIEFQAFYRCESLTEVVVPSSVTNLGMTVFAFCSNLIRAEIRAQIEKLPDWTFYGCESLSELVLPETVKSTGEYSLYDCESLNTVVYPGSKNETDKIRDDVVRDTGDGLISVSGSSGKTEDSYQTIIEKEDGSVSSVESTVNENSAIKTEQTVIYPEEQPEPEKPEINVDITLENSSGWNNLVGFIENNQNTDASVKVDVYVKDDSEIPSEVIAALYGKEVILEVHNASGAVWKMDFSKTEAGEKAPAINISHSYTAAEEKHLKLMECEFGYRIVFEGDAEINAEVMIQLPLENARKTATLYTLKGGKLTKHQTVLVDGDGTAHFYLASVAAKNVYLIGIDVPGEEGNAIIPQNMYNEYTLTDSEGIEYKITGRSSSWGMNLGQVMGILGAVMAGAIVLIGGGMFIWNRQKLKNGYVPDFEDEDE